MIGTFSQKFLEKVSRVFTTTPLMKIVNRNDAFGYISKQTSSLQNATFTSLIPTSCFFAPHARRILDKYTKPQLKQPLANQLRTVVKFSYQKGARKSVKAVPARFFRLRWGVWIRTIAGRHRKLWKKTNRRRNELLNHVFCNHTQSKMLDKMVNRFWRVPKYYIEDPYEVYHTRENYFYTRKKPWRPDGVDYE